MASRLKRRKMPSPRRIRELLDYDPRSGELRWRQVTTNRVKVGAIAGYPTGERGFVLGIDGFHFLASRAIWIWMTGMEPPLVIDHWDLNTRNNAWSNLRAASESENGANKKAQSNNKSGLKGVSKTFGCQNRWTARINKEGRKYYLGSFGSADEAHAAYATKAKELYGEFARVGLWQ